MKEKEALQPPTEHIRFDKDADALVLLDQRYLPTREEDFVCTSVDDIITALQVMVVRGAPAIGVTAAYGCYLAARRLLRDLPPQGPDAADGENWAASLNAELERIAAARPTAVNLAWAVNRMREAWRSRPGISLPTLSTLWLDLAKRMQAEDEQINRTIGAHGQTLLEDGARVMTHCNAGALATAGWGTALGVIYAAKAAGKQVRVIANETRPFLQGARLTAFELSRAGVDVRVACDNAAAHLMHRGLVDAVIVGADRIAANGDVANKIGTYTVALAAKAHDIPFYVAAPTSTVDLATPTGADIPIEERDPREVTHPTGETPIVPDNVQVYNFAFDVTPHELVTAIITEQGVLRPPYAKTLAQAVHQAETARKLAPPY